MNVIIYQQTNERSRRICNAMLAGVKSLGDEAKIVSMEPDKIAPVGDVAIFYGQSNGGKELLKSYVDAGKHAIYVDMGYWNRKTKADVYGGFHKVALDDVHPTRFQMAQPVNDDRFLNQGVQIKVDRARESAGHILLAGLSGKASAVNELNPYQWELETIKRLKEVTDRTIVYRPKPSWKDAKPIPGTVFSSRAQDLNDVLLSAHCVVTRHSNVTIDGLIEAIPGFTQLGAAQDICYSFDDLGVIEAPQVPDFEERYEFCSKLAYCQWNLAEMTSGEAWKWYRGLIS